MEGLIKGSHYDDSMQPTHDFHYPVGIYVGQNTNDLLMELHSIFRLFVCVNETISLTAGSMFVLHMFVTAFFSIVFSFLFSFCRFFLLFFSIPLIALNYCTSRWNIECVLVRHSGWEEKFNNNLFDSIATAKQMVACHAGADVDVVNVDAVIAMRLLYRELSECISKIYGNDFYFDNHLIRNSIEYALYD